MKKLTLLLILFIPFMAIGQNFVMTWQQCYGGGENDKVKSIIPYNNGYLVFGYTNSTDGDISINECNGAAWLVNIDARGEIIFEKTYCGFGGATGYKIIANEQNGFYLLGSTGPNHYGGVNGYWLAQADTNFNIIWQDVLGGSYVEDPRGGCIAHDGGVIECGLTGSPDGDIEESYGNFDNWLVKMNPDGSRDWVKTYANVGGEEGGHILPTRDGGYLFIANGENLIPGNIYCEGHDNKMSEAWIIKLNADGEVEWHQCYGGSDTELLRGILELDDGFVISGSSYSDDYDLPGNHGANTADIWIVKLDTVGELIWSKNFGGSKTEHADHVFLNKNNTYTVIGQTKSTNYDVQGNTNTLNSAVPWLMIINENGELIYQKPFPELTEVQGFYSVVKVSDYKYIIAVTKDTWGCNYTQSNPSQDDIYVFEIQDMDEFIPSQAQGNSSVCLSTETETYYSTELVIDTMETQWLLLPEEAGEITALHDSVLITWDPNFQDTAWLQVRAVNEYGESAYSTPKEIIVYSPLIIADITGPDSLCSATNTQTIFSTQLTEESQEINWYLQPETAGTILNQQDTAIITWNPVFEGQVSLKTGIFNKCDMEEYSSSKVVKVRNCLGVSQEQAKELKFYPNPATNQITFELPSINKQSQLQIKDIYGKLIATLKIKPNQSKLIWECGGFASGVYFYEGEIGGEVYRGKFLIE